MSKHKHNLNGIFVSSHFQGNQKTPKKTKKLRQISDKNTKVNPITGKRVSESTYVETSTLKPDGSISITKEKVAAVWDCGCPVSEPFGGVCFDTGANLCKQCRLICACCGKNLSKSAAYPYENVVLCLEDFEEAKERRFFRNLFCSEGDE